MGPEIVTIVNQSGKIINTGGKLVNILKEAKASYDERKAAMKAELAIKRSNTFDVRTVPRYHEETYDDGQDNYEYEYGDGDVMHAPRQYQHDDAASVASSRRSHSSRKSRGTVTRQNSQGQARPALTMDNLKTHSEVSSVAPSRAPAGYRPPYAETSGDMQLSRPKLAKAHTFASDYHGQSQELVSSQRAPMQRSRSDPAAGDLQVHGGSKQKDIDMDLAYGSIPPDLAERVDLDPVRQAPEKEDTAKALIEKVENMLVEANCLQHSASHMITHLQENPEAAAAVALTLAELSAVVGKMSPAFLGVLKGGSPAIFALLASPHFMIAAGLAVGVTVVMFGGWKIVKKVQEQQAAQQAVPMLASGPDDGYYPVRAAYSITEAPMYDEALVVEEELSTIESWRRGISVVGEDESADLELISPVADRSIRSQYGDDDLQSERSFRSSRTGKSSSKAGKASSTFSRGSDAEVPSRKSSKTSSSLKNADAVSEAGSQRSHRSHRSEKSDRTSKTSHSKRTLAIEDGGKEKDNVIEAVVRPKKDSLLKNMFKKKTEALAIREKASPAAKPPRVSSGIKVN
ncbi:MFS transporter ACS family pantothenate transporter [Microdochium nivale]|nr:MFS transporter ACS family pantothenate transporter [Microdochium nivale]